MGKTMKCDVIRDLIPSYIDGLCSDDSNEIIKEHLSVCEECKEYYMQMIKEISADIQSESDELNPFIKIKRNTAKKIFFAMIITACVISVIWEQYTSFYTNGESMYSEEIDVRLDEKYGIATLEFVPKEDDVIVDIGYGREVDISVNGKKPLETLHLIKRNYHEKYNGFSTNQYQLYFVDDDTALDLFSVANEFQYEEDDYFAVLYNDGYQIIYLKDLREGKVEQIEFIDDTTVW